MSEQIELKSGARYGELPFDKFVLAHWDYARSVSEDQNQWNEHVQAWLALTPSERLPYRGENTTPHTEDQISRVLQPHQTNSERNLGRPTCLGRWEPICLRVDYSSELDESFEHLSDEMEGYFVLTALLNDKRLYGHLAGDWTGILLRLPSLTDRDQTNPPEDRAPFNENPAWEAEAQAKAMLFVLDREALEEQRMKVLWLDTHGMCVWDNKVAYDGEENEELQGFAGSINELMPIQEITVERGGALSI